MARIRMIKPEFFDDPDVGELSAEAALFFIGLWTQADREGRIEDDMRRLKARIFPYRGVDCEALAVELHGRDMIRRYQEQGKCFIWIRNFTKHQRPHPKEPASVIPPCGNGAGKRNGEPGKETANPSESGVLILDSGVLIPDARSVHPPASADVSPAFLEFPVVGQGGKTWTLSEAQVAEWAKLFPNLDIAAEARKALAWSGANPGHRKTSKGMPKFLVNWFGRAVDSGRATSRPEKTLPARRDGVQNGSSCPHTPRCQSSVECVALVIEEGRAQRQ